ncbi:MAG: holo-[acyl-carrier-protein] synthase [Phycisphaerales bacterium]|nr:holo-[acyl-carrier-protein] synthase [Phycisphaerales bacterium]
MNSSISQGVDLVEVDRIERLMQENPAEFAARCFREEEVAYCDGSGALRMQRYASRFAAKEAAMKALGTGWTNGVSFTDVEVFSAGVGAPQLRLHGRFAEVASELGLHSWSVSLSHTKQFAVAVVIALRSPPGC